LNTIFLTQASNNDFQSKILESYQSLIGKNEAILYSPKNLAALKKELYEKLLKNPDSLIICDNSLELFAEMVIAKTIQVIQYGASPQLSFFYAKSQVITVDLEEFVRPSFNDIYNSVREELVFLDLEHAFLKASKFSQIPSPSFSFDFINHLYPLAKLPYLENLNDDFFSPSQEILDKYKNSMKEKIKGLFGEDLIPENNSWHLCLSNHFLSDQENILVFGQDLSAMKYYFKGQEIAIESWHALINLISAFDTYENLSSWKKIDRILELLFASPKALSEYKHERMVDTYHAIRLATPINTLINQRSELIRHFNPSKAIWANDLKDIYTLFNHFDEQKYFFTMSPDIFTGSLDRKNLQIDFPKKEFVRYKLDLGNEGNYFFETIYGKRPEFTQPFS
jgi:hypothetical protein